MAKERKFKARERLILEYVDLLCLAEELRRARKKVVTTNGCFGLLHVGHVRYLAEARALGDVLIVGLNSDRSVRGLKGPGRPLLPEGERAEVLLGLRSVDYVFIFGEDHPEKFLRTVKPQIHVKGGAHPLEGSRSRRVVEELGGVMMSLPLYEARSTTGIIEAIRSGEVKRKLSV